MKKRVFGFMPPIFSRQKTKKADEWSRILPIEIEWELSDWAFYKVNEKLGSFEIDLFASKMNRKCLKYVSWHRDPDSFAIDAFTISWSNFYFYAFPPFCLILQVLQKIKTDKAERVVVAPFWPFQFQF